MADKVIHRSVWEARLHCGSATQPLVAAAIHESCHVVLSLALGYRVSEVSISTNGTGNTTTAKGQRIHNPAESALFAAAGMAGEKRYSKMPMSEHNFTSDVDSIMSEYPSADWEDIALIEERALSIIEKWPGAIDALSLALLKERRLSAEDIEAVVSSTSGGRRLANSWRSREQWKPVDTPAQVKSTSFTNEDAIATLTGVIRLRKAGVTLPKELAAAVRNLEATQLARSNTAPAGIRYSDPAPLNAQSQPGYYTRQPVRHYEHRAILPTIDNHEYRSPR